MKIIILNGRKMLDKEVSHKYLKKKLMLPDYYGENLDALWDILSTLTESIKIKVVNIDDIYKNLGPYGEEIINLFKDVVEENHNVNLEIILWQ